MIIGFAMSGVIVWCERSCVICQIVDLVKANYICLERTKGSKTPFCKKNCWKVCEEAVCSLVFMFFGQSPLGEKDICSVSICCEGSITQVIWVKLCDELVRKVTWARCSSVWVSFPKFCWARRSPFAQILEVLPRLVRLKWIVLAALSFLLSDCIHHCPLRTNNHFCQRYNHLIMLNMKLLSVYSLPPYFH